MSDGLASTRIQKVNSRFLELDSDASHSDSKTLPAFGATGPNDSAATAGLHANEKAMGAGTTGLRGLVGAFHFMFLLCF
jgi:hypothetical protein